MSIKTDSSLSEKLKQAIELLNEVSDAIGGASKQNFKVTVASNEGGPASPQGDGGGEPGGPGNFNSIIRQREAARKAALADAQQREAENRARLDDTGAQYRKLIGDVAFASAVHSVRGDLNDLDHAFSSLSVKEMRLLLAAIISAYPGAKELWKDAAQGIKDYKDDCERTYREDLDRSIHEVDRLEAFERGLTS